MHGTFGTESVCRSFERVFEMCGESPMDCATCRTVEIPRDDYWNFVRPLCNRLDNQIRRVKSGFFIFGSIRQVRVEYVKLSAGPFENSPREHAWPDDVPGGTARCRGGRGKPKAAG